MRRDEAAESPFGQHTRDAFHLADFFLDSDSDNWEAELDRFLALIFGNPHICPSREEHAMFLAFGASLRSSDLSRQVGALLMSARSEFVAVGANEAPQSGGGQYWPPQAQADDNRDVGWGFDSNERERDRMIGEVLRRVPLDEDQQPEAKQLTEAKQMLRGTGLLDLTEFGRAVHAEMAALTAALRIGVSPLEGTLFVTTFPCHNCAKHLVASGISRVMYVEPYPKSRALDLHKDSITTEPEDATRVRFVPFMGVGPRRFFDLFSLKLSSGKKLRHKAPGGNKVEWRPKDASPRVPLPVMTYLQRETTILSGVSETLPKDDE